MIIVNPRATHIQEKVNWNTKATKLIDKEAGNDNIETEQKV